MKRLMTQALVDELRSKGARVEVWDTKLLNFFVQIRESGRGAYYLRYTRPATGELVSYRLGDAQSLSVADARTLAQSHLGRIALGEDPADVKRQRRTCPTLSAVVNDYYLPHVKLTKKSWDTDESILRCHVLPVLGNKSLAAITTADIDALIQSMYQDTNAPSGKGYAAATCNRAVVLLRYLFNLAIDRWALPGVRTNPAKKAFQFELNNERQVFLSPEQIGCLLKAGAPHPGQQNPFILPIVMLIVLTGVRRSNALKARWSEFDEERALWLIPITKSGKPQTIQLSQEVLSLLAALPTRGTSEYLFPNPKTRKPFKNIHYSWDTMRKKAGLGHVRMHDLRHTFASLLINGGASLYMVQKALGHSNPKITMRYAHLSDDTQRQAFQGAANLIAHTLPDLADKADKAAHGT